VSEWGCSWNFEDKIWDLILPRNAAVEHWGRAFQDAIEEFCHEPGLTDSEFVALICYTDETALQSDLRRSFRLGDRRRWARLSSFLSRACEKLYIFDDFNDPLRCHISVTQPNKRVNLGLDNYNPDMEEGSEGDYLIFAPKRDLKEDELQHFYHGLNGIRGADFQLPTQDLRPSGGYGVEGDPYESYLKLSTTVQSACRGRGTQR